MVANIEMWSKPGSEGVKYCLFIYGLKYESATLSFFYIPYKLSLSLLSIYAPARNHSKVGARLLWISEEGLLLGVSVMFLSGTGYTEAVWGRLFPPGHFISLFYRSPRCWFPLNASPYMHFLLSAQEIRCMNNKIEGCAENNTQSWGRAKEVQRWFYLYYDFLNLPQFMDFFRLSHERARISLSWPFCSVRCFFWVAQSEDEWLSGTWYNSFMRNDIEFTSHIKAIRWRTGVPFQASNGSGRNWPTAGVRLVSQVSTNESTKRQFILEAFSWVFPLLQKLHNPLLMGTLSLATVALTTNPWPKRYT